MSRHAWLRKHTPSAKRPIVRRRRLDLERLEDRTLLTAYSFTKIAEGADLQTDPINVHSISMNASGMVAFSGSTPTGPGIKRGDGGALVTVASPSGSIQWFQSASINDNGLAAFQTAFGFDGGVNSWGIYTGDGAGQPTPIEIGSPSFDYFGPPAINASGKVVYTGAHFVPGTSLPCLRLNDGGNATTLIEANDRFMLFHHEVAINAQDEVLFLAMEGSSTNFAQYLLKIKGGTLETIADTTGPFFGFMHNNTALTINNAGTAAFTAYKAGGVDHGIFKTDGAGGYVTVVETNATFDYLDGLALNDNGTVAFAASWRDGQDQFILDGVYVGDDPVSDKVLARGDTLFGEIVQGVTSEISINNRGQIAFSVYTDAGNFYVVRAEPGTLDGDGDGIPNAIEDGALHNGDGDDDGTPDKIQPNVASLPNAVDGRYVTLAAPVGSKLQNVQARELSPGYVETPVGAFRFTLTNLQGNPGSVQTVKLILPDKVTVNGVYGYGPTADDRSDHYYDLLAANATIEGNVVSLHKIDGQLGDDDLEQDGKIQDDALPVRIGTGAGEIKGVAYDDRNGNNVHDAPGEPVIGGRTVFIDLDHDGVLDGIEPRATTDPVTGAYHFTGAANGTYDVSMGVPAGWAPTWTDLSFAIAEYPPLTTTSGTDAYFLALHDFDGEAGPDIVAVGPDGIYLMLNDRAHPGRFLSPYFSPGQVIDPLSFSRGPVAVGDFNGDRFDDLVVADGVNLVIYYQDPSSPNFFGFGSGSGEYRLIVDFNHFARDVTVGDFDHNGLDDLAWVTNDPAQPDDVPIARVALQLPDHSFVHSGYSIYLTQPPLQGLTITSGDFNGDGWLDLVAGQEGGIVAVLPNHPENPGTFAGWRGYALDASAQPRAIDDVTAADLNHDGRPDVVGVNRSRVWLLPNDPAAPRDFGPPTLFRLNDNRNFDVTGMAAGDFNGDGLMDLAGGGEQDLKTWFMVLLNHPLTHGTFPALREHDVTTIPAGGDTSDARFVTLVSADLNDDGLMDIVSSLQPGGALTGFNSIWVGLASRVKKVTVPTPDPVNFGTIRTTASIKGTVLHDANANGQLDGGEPRLKDWQVYVDLDEDGVPDPGEPSATSAPNGTFEIAIRTAGQAYRLAIVRQPGWSATTAQVGYHLVSVRRGQDVTGLLFGNAPDADADAVSDVVENAAPNNGDGNNDGIRDSLQPDVASLPNAVDRRYVTLEVSEPAGAPLVDVRAVAPAPGDIPPGFAFPFGTFHFTVPGNSATVLLYHPRLPGVFSGYWKYGPEASDLSPHYYRFTHDGVTGAQFDDKPIPPLGTYITTLSFRDGQRGDDVLFTQDGVIRDPGGLAVPADHPPVVTDVVINDGPIQRSKISRITVSFNDVVAIDSGAFELKTIKGKAIKLKVVSTLVGGHTESVLTFKSNTEGGSLKDGKYVLKVLSAKVHDAAGRVLDGDVDGTEGGDEVESFFRMYGDANGNGLLDDADYALLLGAKKSKKGEARYLDYFDFDGDGKITGADVSTFLTRKKKKSQP